MRLFPFVLLLLLTACGSDKYADFKPLNLLEYNVPLTIMAPDSSSVSKQAFGMFQEVSIENEKTDNYHVRVLFQEASGSMQEIKDREQGFLKNNSVYTSFTVTHDEPEGFIYETKIDSLVNYGFRRIVIMGSKEYIFQNSISGTYTKEEVEELYQLTLPQELSK